MNEGLDGERVEEIILLCRVGIPDTIMTFTALPLWDKLEKRYWIILGFNMSLDMKR